MKKLIIITLLLTSYYSSYSQTYNKGMAMEADFFVSTITKDSNICKKERCLLSITNDKIQLHTDSKNIVIDQFVFVYHRDALGRDKHGKQWEVMVGNMRKEPYLLLLKSDAVAILVGYECY